MGRKQSINEDKEPRIVWAPLPVLSWILPLVGHVGVTDTTGTIYDFAGPRTIGVNRLLCGPPLLSASVSRVWPDVDLGAWDEALRHANALYATKTHNILANNCHHHVACVLDGAGVCASSWAVWWAIVRHGQYVRASVSPLVGGMQGRVRVYGPFVLLCILSTLAFATLQYSGRL